MLAVNLWEFLGSGEARWVIGLAGFAVLSAGITYLVGRWRESTAEGEPPASLLLTNLTELKGQGVVDAGEYRTIKTALEARLRDERQAVGSKT
jgi:hypothetical protein